MSSGDYQHCQALIQLPPKGPYRVSQFLHILRAYGTDGQLTGKPSSSQEVLDALLNDNLGKRYFGETPLVQTRNGVRYSRVLGGNRESEKHRDQVLATLAELGGPLSRPLQIGKIETNVRAVLDDSIANFYIEQRELAWTAIAYSLYLPPSREWSNRYGERTTFNELAEKLLSSPLEKNSCGGLHMTCPHI